MGRSGLMLVACLLAATASAQDFTALKCHISRTPRLPPSATLQLEALVPDFAGRNCRVIGRTKTLCTPVRVTSAEPAFPGPSFSSAPLDRGYACYRIECDSDTPKRHEVVDAFGGGQEDFFRNVGTEICMPAVVDSCDGGSCGHFTTTCHESGKCSCFTLSRKQHFCGAPVACSDTFRCQAGLQDSKFGCPDGYVCETNTCCGGPVCVPLSTVCASGDPAPPVPPSGTRTTVGVMP